MGLFGCDGALGETPGEIGFGDQGESEIDASAPSAAFDGSTSDVGAADPDAGLDPEADAQSPDVRVDSGSNPSSPDAGTDAESPDAQADSASNPGTNPPIKSGKKCVLVLSGAGQNNGGAAETSDPVGFSTITPPKLNDPNIAGSGAFWVYDGPHDFSQTAATGDNVYARERDRVADFLVQHGCGPTLVVGGSNGGAFAAKLYCKGEDFGGRIWGFFFKDPVWDRGVFGCSPSPNTTHTVAVHSVWLKHAAENAPNQQCNRMLEVDYSQINSGWYADSWYCQDNRSVSEATWEAETGVVSILAGNAHIGSYDIEPDLAEWTMTPVLWCDWIRANEASVPSGCDWTFSHSWHD